MIPPLEAARELLEFLDASSFTSCLIGALAVQRWGEPRLTHDADATVLAPYGEEIPVIDALLARFAPRRPDARRFALDSRVVLITASNGVDLDVSLAAFDFEREVLQRATPFAELKEDPGLARPFEEAWRKLPHL